ncbi:PAS domain S-box protein [Chroococcus sp. FPU101]|uniref:PAS domain S-box protein n=1 Tax=Chroococcus sp. FPU101 TaxID=1974212 RepID=UPI001A8D5A44|nr:PAS domain S-box protein [Chroococcus sp. FPU101]GFE69918.1 hypothetical protein CFPU101_25280 [Chroococcus sp. FPU101]
MLEVINNLFTSSPFIPHGHCYLWKSDLVWLHLVSDGLIALAYYSIPISLLYFVRRRVDLPYAWMFLLFGGFIIACGTTHIIEIWTLWYPTYWLSGIIKAMTALISVTTASMLVPLIPKALALPSPAVLEREIIERKQAQTALKQAHDELEIRVRERTEEIVKANQKLSIEIIEREQTQKALQQSESQNKAIIAAIPDLLLRVKKDGFCIDCRVPKDINLESFVPITHHLSEVLPAKLVQNQLEYIEQALTTKELQVYEHQFFKYDRLAYEEIRITPLNHDEVLIIVRDITTRKQLEEKLHTYKTELEQRVQERTKQLLETNQALQQSEARYRAIVDDQTELITRFQSDGTLTFINDAYCRYFGVRKEELIGNCYEPLIVEDDREQVAKLINSISVVNPVVTIENRVIVGGQIRWTQWINRMILDEQGRFLEYQSVGRDTTEVKQAETIITRSRDFYLALFEKFPTLIWRSDVNAQCNYFNQTWLDFTGRTIEQEMGDGWLEGVHPEDLYYCLETYLETIQARQTLIMEYRLRRYDGVYCWLANYGVPFYDLDGNFAGYIGSCYLIDARKQAEAALQNAYEELEQRVKERTTDLAHANQELQTEIAERKRAEEQIKTSLKEKEVLLQEIHHRVKNNLQVICSLLNLQSRSIKDETAYQILKESQNRVRAMALIHEKLYQSQDLSRINFAEYIHYLATNLFRSYGINTSIITLKTEISPRILLDVDEALSCGLIVNELISNSLKYAFPENQLGEITVKIQFLEQEGLVLLIGDNGIGLPSDFDLDNPKTLGLKLVKSWIAQSRGTLKINSISQGIQFKITFPSLK